MVGLDREEAGERVALLRGETAAVAIGVQESLALRLGHIPKLAEGAGDLVAAIGREAAKLLNRVANLLTLRRAEAGQSFVVIQESLALLGRHVVELCETVAQPLLGFRGETAEAGFALERFLLLLRGKVAMALHPLLEMGAVSGMIHAGGVLPRHAERREGSALAAFRLLCIRRKMQDSQHQSRKH